VLFVNGIPVATLELKSEFKQSAGRAIHQYRSDRQPKDPVTGKPEPLLTFKRGALVHFAVSQFEVAMCTRLAGMDSVFLPCNKGTKDGGQGNDVPDDGWHPTSYLWREVLARETKLNILGRFVHLQIQEKEDWQAQPIIIVTIQTFPFVLEEIQKNATLKTRNFAIIADEAHSSQTGSTARKLREVLMAEQRDEDEEEISAEDMLDLALEARRGSKNLSYFAFTATPKPRTLELFGRRPDPTRPPAKDNLPEAFHVYSMRQAIEEGFILDVLRNYTTYGTAYKIAQQTAAADEEVDSKKASKELGIWIKLHPHNIGQRVQVIVEHFRKHVQGLLGGQAKAMVVTSSRVEAVRYKLAFDKYLARLGYTDLQAMVAFSGEVIDAESADFPLTERNMNPGLKGRDMRKAFDTGDYQVMIVANKFQTGFDQPKLCAMYVLKRLSGVDCVQTLSRLNRTYPGKAETGTFVLDFVNDPQEVLDSFLKYHKTAALSDVSDPNQVHTLFDKLGAEAIYQWSEVEQFHLLFFNKKKGGQALSSI
jgi:type I restriction enzyme R subunit